MGSNTLKHLFQWGRQRQGVSFMGDMTARRHIYLTRQWRLTAEEETVSEVQILNYIVADGHRLHNSKGFTKSVILWQFSERNSELFSK